MVSRIGREIEISPVELASRIARNNGDSINLAGGSPDPRTIPHLELRQIYHKVIEEYGAKAFAYPGAGGQEILIEALRSYLRHKGIATDHDGIVITSGAQHAINLIAEYFLSSGSTVAVENPTFIETFTSLKLRTSVVHPIDLQEDGIDVDRLDLVTKLSKVELVYIIPNCHNPAGVTLSIEKRKRLVELAEDRDFYIIEDDPYRPLSHNLPQSVKELDYDSRVLYVGTFSKVLAPGLRVGYIVGPREITDRLALMEQMDFSTSTVNQYVIAEALTTGLIDKREEWLHSHYNRKVEILSRSLEEAGISYRKPSCGYFVLSDIGVDSWKSLEQASGAGVLYTPASPFFMRGGETMARLSASMESCDRIREGVRRLSEVLKKMR